MNTHILEIVSAEGLRAKVALDLHLGAVKLNVVVKSLHCFDWKVTSIANDFEALALVDHMLVEVR